MMEKRRCALYLALIHHPVLNRRGEEIASAVTNLDLHDLARLACTYDLPAVHVVTPIEDQQRLVERLLHHWFHNVGRALHPDREKALRRLRVVDSLDEVSREVERETGKVPLLWAASARATEDSVAPWVARRLMEDSDRPGVLILGTAWGLAPSVTARCDGFWRPIEGRAGYNHLSVRCAAAILVDRFFHGDESKEGDPSVAPLLQGGI